MERVLTSAQMREADNYTIHVCGVPSSVLMRRAGKAVADEVEKAAKERKSGDNAGAIVVVCGTGNNGGDGYVCAQELLLRGYPVKVYAFEGRLSEDCERERAAYGGAYTDGLDGDILVDCIFGTGLCRPVTGAYAAVIEKINASGAYVIAADIPSGLHGDSGAVLGCAVKADLTVAVAEYKAGMFLGDGLDFCGKVVKKDIGIVCPPAAYAQLYEDGDAAAFFPARRRNTHKGSYGAASLVAGSAKYPGAAVLALRAALQSGCGYVRLTAEEKVRFALAPRLPQVIYEEDIHVEADAVALGMGCGVSEKLYGRIGRLARGYGGTLVIDADGLNALAKYGVGIIDGAKCRVIVTPHVKEFSRLTGMAVGEILADPLAAACAFAVRHHIIVLLKGAATVVTDGQRTAINTAGTTALSKGGSGDMLSGFLCGTLARGVPPFDAAVLSAYTLGRAAELASREKTDYCATARDIVKGMSLAVKQFGEISEKALDRAGKMR